MKAIHPHFITDGSGKKISVVLPIEEYKNLLEELEELEDIRLYDKVKASEDPSVPIDEAFKMIDLRRKTGK